MGRQLAERGVLPLDLSRRERYTSSNGILVREGREGSSLLLVPFTAGRFAGEGGSLDLSATARALGDIDIERDREARNLFLRTSAEGGSSEDLDFVRRL